MVLLGAEALVEARFGPFRDRANLDASESSSESSVRLEIVLILTQDRCTVCVEHNIGLEIILHAPNGAPW